MLKEWEEKLSLEETGWASFREPDIGNELTAIAIYSEPERFKGMRLF